MTVKAVRILFFATLLSFSGNAIAQHTTELYLRDKETQKPSELYRKTVISAYQSANENDKYVSEGYIIAELLKNDLIRSDKDIPDSDFLIQRSETIQLKIETLKP